MSKLLSCPFCGNASPRRGGSDREGDMIICRAMDCGAVMYADDEETVIVRWNTRAPAQALPDLERLASKIERQDVEFKTDGDFLTDADSELICTALRASALPPAERNTEAE